AASSHGGDVDDLARALADHHAADRLREEKDAGEVRRDHRVPFRPGQVLEWGADPVAGVVDQDIDAAELVQSLRDGAVDLPSVTTRRVTLICSRSIRVGTFGAISFFQ